jgi:hypothetical protein
MLESDGLDTLKVARWFSVKMPRAVETRLPITINFVIVQRAHLAIYERELQGPRRSNWH